MHKRQALSRQPDARRAVAIELMAARDAIHQEIGADKQREVIDLIERLLSEFLRQAERWIGDDPLDVGCRCRQVIDDLAPLQAVVEDVRGDHGATVPAQRNDNVAGACSGFPDASGHVISFEEDQAVDRFTAGEVGIKAAGAEAVGRLDSHSSPAAWQLTDQRDFFGRPGDPSVKPAIDVGFEDPALINHRNLIPFRILAFVNRQAVAKVKTFVEVTYWTIKGSTFVTFLRNQIRVRSIPPGFVVPFLSGRRDRSKAHRYAIRTGAGFSSRQAVRQALVSS